METLIAGLILIFFFWLALKILRFVFRLAKSLIGWVGPFAIALLPGMLNYMVLHSVLDVSADRATMSGALMTAILGLWTNSSEC